MDLNFLKKPNLNSFILGLIIGLPQGLTITTKRLELLKASSNQNELIVTIFGLFAPPLLMIINIFIMKNKENKPISKPKHKEYSNPLLQKQ